MIPYIFVAALLLFPAVASAQDLSQVSPQAAAPAASLSISAIASRELQRSLTLAPEGRDWGLARVEPPAAATAPAQSTGRDRSVGRKILGSALVGTAGFFLGGYTGAWIDGECGGCDDPGLMGALIGAPIGAAVGAIVGWKLF